MIRMTQAFKERLEAGDKPFFLSSLESPQSRRIFGKEMPEFMGSSVYWDGSWSIGDGTRGGADLGVTDVQARVLQFGSQSKQLVVNSKDLMTSLSMGEIGTFQTVYDNSDGYFSELMGEDREEFFVNQTLEILCGFHGLDPGDYLTLFRGTVIQQPLNNKTLKIIAEGSTTSLYETYELPKASLYTNPENQNEILPYIYGDLTENAGESGLWVCPCIDTVNDVYALSGFALQTAAQGNSFTLYDDDGEISSSDYTITNGDYESVGVTITYATFSVAPTGKVSCICKGKANASGTVLTNPIDILEDFLDVAGDVTVREATSWSMASYHADAEGYTCAGMMLSDNNLAYWLTDILSSFLGSWYLNGQQELVISLDTDNLKMFDIAGVLDERKATRISGDAPRSNICNQLLVNYALTANQQDRRFTADIRSNYLMIDEGEESKDTQSQDKYGVRKKTLKLNWTRNTATINALQTRIVGKYDGPTWTVDFAESGFRLPQVEPGDFVLYSWEERKDADGLVLKNQIARVLGIEHDYDRQTMSFTLWDTGEYYPQEPKKWDGSWSIGDGSTGGGTRDRRNLV